ncbi:MAG: hypothetical protein F4Z51_09700 [Chloroflexi bacterium]|nr:hypothetical protein [Chloroflexota bacterium]MYD17304.1 hypothetical protein [Chloroflexota bacterium]
MVTSSTEPSSAADTAGDVAGTIVKVGAAASGFPQNTPAGALGVAIANKHLESQGYEGPPVQQPLTATSDGVDTVVENILDSSAGGGSPVLPSGLPDGEFGTGDTHYDGIRPADAVQSVR